MLKRSDNYKVWVRDDSVVEQALLANQSADAELTAYGENDSVLDYLMTSGLWSILTGMESDGLQAGNGYSSAILNGVEVIRELASIGRIQQCGKVLADTRLMMQAGFNLARIARATEGKRSVIDPETLANHLNRISPESAQRTFMAYVREMRQRRLIRGQVYAADAHEITIPYGRSHERIGRVGEKYGFKLVMLINVLEDRERIVGFAFAPLPTSERTMLLEILKRLDQEVAPLREWLQILLLDRGYWGAKYLLGLHEQYQIDVVTRARHEGVDTHGQVRGTWAKKTENRRIHPRASTGNPAAGLEVVDYIETSLAEASWQEQLEEHSRFGTIKVRSAGVKDVPLYDEKGKVLGKVNAVVADEFDTAGKRLKGEDGNERPRFYYVTTMPLPNGYLASGDYIVGGG